MRFKSMNLDPSLAILSALPTFTSLPAMSAHRVLTTDAFYVASHAQCDGLVEDPGDWAAWRQLATKPFGLG